MSRSERFLCGVKEAQCTGTHTQFSQNYHGPHKTHGSREEAFRCKVKSLLDAGYTRIDAKTFSPPDGGPLLVLTKVSKFGAVVRQGKEGRYMPENVSGSIIG